MTAGCPTPNSANQNYESQIAQTCGAAGSFWTLSAGFRAPISFPLRRWSDEKEELVADLVVDTAVEIIPPEAKDDRVDPRVCLWLRRLNRWIDDDGWHLWRMYRGLTLSWPSQRAKFVGKFSPTGVSKRCPDACQWFRLHRYHRYRFALRQTERSSLRLSDGFRQHRVPKTSDEPLADGFPVYAEAHFQRVPFVA